MSDVKQVERSECGERSGGSTADENGKKRIASFEIFRKSKKIVRSPTTAWPKTGDLSDEVENSSSDNRKSPRGVRKCKENTRMEGKIDHLTSMMANFMADIKTSINEIKHEINDLKEVVAEVIIGAEQTDKEVRAVKDANKETSEKLKEEIGRWEMKSAELEIKLEKIEREKIRNNVVLSGIAINERDPSRLKMAIKNLVKDKMGIDIEIIKAYKVGERRCIFELDKWEDKIEILKNKIKLVGSEIYMDSDLTQTERMIMKKIRERAREEREKGNRVKLGHLKLIMAGKVIFWDEQKRELIERKLDAPDPTLKN